MSKPPTQPPISDPSLCPLCGAANHCAQMVRQQQPSGQLPSIQEGSSCGAECWCFHTNVPQTLLKQLPADSRGTACICSSCVEKALSDK